MLSITAEYALRAMVHLARAEEGTAIRGRELATLSSVPPNYLSKILLELAKAGLVTATRGTGGGYRLTREAGTIPLVSIVEVFDAARAHPRCLLDFARDCSDDKACSAHGRWREVRTNYVDFLAATTLAEIAEQQGARHD